jgi:hypothetical protein
MLNNYIREEQFRTAFLNTFKLSIDEFLKWPPLVQNEASGLDARVGRY